MSRETANAARYAKGLTVLTELEGDLLEALENIRAEFQRIEKLPTTSLRDVIYLQGVLSVIDTYSAPASDEAHGNP